nr:SLRFamide [Urechis unicinctus]
MNSFNFLIVVAAIASLHITTAMPRIDSLDANIGDLGLRDAEDDITPRKPTRDNGLGSLLLKNLRFRDLLSQPRPDSNSLYELLQQANLPSSNTDIIYPGELAKRGGVTVSQLAELLHSLKSRDLDDAGVKLQSLRFGRK